MATVIFRDETMSGREIATFSLHGVPDTITVEELIRLRVREEVARYNARPVERFHALVRPTGAEAELNGYRFRTPRRIDWEQQAELAVKAFTKNGFVVFVGGRQVSELDEPVDLTAAADVAFVRLVPLVGG